MKKIEAMNEAARLLRDEANELAGIAHTDVWKSLSHRARCAIQNELRRLRSIADILDGGKQ